MEDELRIVTWREIFEGKFLTEYNACVAMALKVLDDVSIGFNPKIDYNMDNILSLSTTLYISANQNRGYIESEKVRRQEAIDKKFGVQVKNV